MVVASDDGVGTALSPRLGSLLAPLAADLNEDGLPRVVIRPW